MKKVLVFDFGASSGRALLCSYENKSFYSMELHRFSNSPITVDGELCWNIDQLLREVEKSLDKAQGYGFDAVSIDTWGVDFALVDKSGAFVQKPVHYRDGRTDGVAERIYRTLPEKELYLRTGIQQMQINTLYQLAAIRDSKPQLLAKTHRMLMMPDLFAYFLTGKMKNEYTIATTSGLVNPKTRSWDMELIDRLGLPKKIFGEIIMPGESYGLLKAKFTDKQIPVIAVPSHDTASAVMAVPSHEKSFAYISCGTWALLGTELAEPLINSDTYDAQLTNEGGYGGTITFLKNITGTWFLQECRRFYNQNGESLAYNDLEAFARSAKPAVARIDPNHPAFMKPGDMPQKICEYCEQTGQNRPKTIAQILRVIYESLADEFARTLNNMEKITGKTYPTLYIFGGGSKDAFLCELTANATGRNVVAGPSEATAIGNAMCVLIALGEIENIAEARRIIRRGETIKEYLPKKAQ